LGGILRPPAQTSIGPFRETVAHSYAHNQGAHEPTGTMKETLSFQERDDLPADAAENSAT
jgi:hypothetical protein